MTDNTILFFAFIIALAIGFFLGLASKNTRFFQTSKSSGRSLFNSFFNIRSDRHVDSRRPHFWPQRKYFEGLTYLLNDQPDQAIDTFISVMDVTPETLETHLALGNLLRKRGELARAVKVHQNLLARPSLPRQQLHRVQLELAVDYVRSGLLDRAEILLKELVDLHSIEVETRAKATEYLVEIYQDMGEWLPAIDAADRLTSSKFSFTPDRWQEIQSHFACELADAALKKKDWLAARRWLRDAIRYDKTSARALMTSAEIHMLDHDFAAAINNLRKVASLHAEYIPDILPLICQSFDALHDPSGLLKELSILYDAQPSILLLRELANSLEKEDGKVAAVNLWLTELPHYDDMGAALELIQVLVEYSNPMDQEYDKIRSALNKLIQAKIAYECIRCGFEGHELHWLCPSCKQWGSSFIRAA